MPYPTKKLGEIGIFNRGITYSKGDLLESCQKGCVTLLRANNINDGLFLDDLQFLPGGFVKNDKILKKDDIIFCMSSGSKHLVGKNAIVSNLDNFSFGAFCSMFRKNTNDDINYISYYFKSNLYKRYIFNFSQGVNILNLKNSDLENCEILLPPLPTQKLIVQKLDSSFEKIDKSIKLTKKNLENIEELNKSFLEEVFREGELVEIGKLIEKTLNWNPNSIGDDFFEYIDISSIDNKNFILTETKKMKGNEAPSRAKQLVIKNDIIFATTRPNLKNIAIIDLDINNLTSSTGFCVLRAIKDKLDFKFLYFYIITDIFLEKLTPLIRGAQYPAISDKDLKSLKIPLPSLQKQKEIVSYLDKVFEKNKALKESYEKKLKDLEEMKQSLLKEAFEGRLIL